MKIGILSDLHLEGSNMEIINPGWDVLILAGDVSADFGALDRFFAYQCPHDIPVIYVLGNHEYEGKKKEEVIPTIKEMIKDFPNIHLLDNESLVVGNVKFIGTTLWSNFESSGYHHKEEIKKWAQTNIVDFSKIYVKKNEKYQYLTPDDMEKDFRKAENFLKYELQNNPFDGIKFVVTHYAPTLQSAHPQYAKNMMNAYWVNDLEHLMGFSQYWVHGHTHNSFSYDCEGTKVICNPRGASLMFDLASNPSFDRLMTVDIPLNQKNNQKKMKP